MTAAASPEGIIWFDNPTLRLEQDSRAPSWEQVTFTAAIKSGRPPGTTTPTVDVLRAIRGYVDAQLAMIERAARR